MQTPDIALTATAAHHPRPLPTKGRGDTPSDCHAITAMRLPPPSWGRDGEGGHPTADHPQPAGNAA